MWAKAKRLPLYLVGGFLRDILMGRPRMPTNVDLAIPAHALTVARELARELEGTYVCLDEQAGSARIVIPIGQAPVELDLSVFRGKTIEKDLTQRDFTINAMAVPLETWCVDPAWKASLIDPLGGQADLAARRLRVCFPKTFREDPVRILRAFRFTVELNCSFDASVSDRMAAAASRLTTVAGERIRDELFAILKTNRAGWALQALNELGALDVLCPELGAGRGIEQGGYHHLDVLDHQLEAVNQCDVLMADFSTFSEPLRQPLKDYCDAALVEGRPRETLVKLAVLFHDVGKPATRRVEADGEIWFLGHEQFGAVLIESVTERLRLSKRESDVVRQLVLCHLRPGHLSREPQLTRRAIFRFFRDLSDTGPACLLLWWADRLATRGPSSRLDQIDQQRMRLEELLRAYFFKAEEVVRPPRLVDGHQVMAVLGLKPGPSIGQLLQAIEEAQAEGLVRSKEEALTLAKTLLKKSTGTSCQ